MHSSLVELIYTPSLRQKPRRSVDNEIKSGLSLRPSLNKDELECRGHPCSEPCPNWRLLESDLKATSPQVQRLIDHYAGSENHESRCK